MQRYVARQAVRLVVGVLGSGLIAAAVAAAGRTHARNLPEFLNATLAQLGQFARMDLGASAVSGASVAHELAMHLPQTAGLILMGMCLALVVGVPFGLLSTFGPARRIAAPLVQIITATPVFCSGLALAFGAVHLLHWPVSVNAPVGASVPPDQLLQITALPVLTIGLAGAATVQLVLRQATARSPSGTFRTSLRRMGLGMIEIEALYIVPQAAAALLSGTREIMMALVSATVVAEWVFHRDGAADLFVKSVALADWNMAALLLFLCAVTMFVADFAGSVLSHILAPGARQ